MSKLHELQQRLNKIAKEMRSLNDEIGDNAWTDEQRSAWDAHQAKYENVESQIKREEQLRAAEDEKFLDKVLDEAEERADEAGVTYGEAFRSLLTNGFGDMSLEERAALKEQRAQSTTVPSKGGYSVPTDFWNRVVEAMKAYGGLANEAFSLSTNHGRDIEWVYTDGTADVGGYIAEGASTDEQDVDMGQVKLGAVKLTSKIIKISNELLQDSAIDIEGLLIRRIASRLARKESAELVVADGSDVNGVTTPTGLQSSVTKTKEAATVGGVTYDDFVNLKHTIDPAYRNGAKYGFNDNTLRALKLLKDSEGRPLWMPSLASGEPSTIDGTPYFIDQGFADIGASAKSVFYGDFTKFIHRRVSGMEIKRLTEKYAEADQIGFLAFMRFGCCLEDGGAIAALQHPAS